MVSYMRFDKKKFIIYLVLAFVIGWSIQLVASMFALQGNTVMFQALVSFTMFAPLVAALIARAGVKKVGWKPQIKKNFKMYLICIAVPVVTTVAGAALFYLVMPGRLDLSGSYLVATLGETAYQQMVDAGITPVLYVAIGIVQSVTFAPILNMFFAVGEEAGWRGVMYPMLKDRYGTTKGRVIGGIIWGAWHWPIMVLAGYEYGLEYWGAPFFGMALFCVCCVVLGIVMDWTYEKTDSIWAPSLAHGAFNAAATVPIILLNVDYINQQIIGPAPVGLIGMIPMAVFVVLVCRKTTNS